MDAFDGHPLVSGELDRTPQLYGGSMAPNSSSTHPHHPPFASLRPSTRLTLPPSLTGFAAWNAEKDSHEAKRCAKMNMWANQMEANLGFAKGGNASTGDETQQMTTGDDR